MWGRTFSRLDSSHCSPTSTRLHRKVFLDRLDDRPPCQWTTFVANRVAKIGQTDTLDNWRHVRSEDIPADLASRGVCATELVNTEIWWHGPVRLKSPQSSWRDSTVSAPDTAIEHHNVKVHVAIPSPPSLPDLLLRFSDLGRALRITAYVIRFIKSCRNTRRSSSLELTGSELAGALETITLTTQRACYQDERRLLKKKQHLPLSRSIRFQVLQRTISDFSVSIQSFGSLTSSIYTQNILTRREPDRHKSNTS